MPASMQSPAILLLSESEKSAQLDRRSLRDAGFQTVQLMTSGIAAARLLAGLDRDEFSGQPRIVVCSHKLEDMDGEQFCAIIRQHPLLLGLPILLIMPNDNEAGQLRTLGCGASALLGRPYSIDALKKQLDLLAKAALPLAKLRSVAKKGDTAAFDSALATYGILLRPAREPEDYFHAGMLCLKEKRWNSAISAFEHALRNAQIKAEAELGMAAAYKGKGDMARFRAWLGRASETLVLARRWHLARTAYARLLKYDPAAKNPFHAQALRLIRQNDYDGAAEALVQSLAVLPKGQTGDRFAQACFVAADPDAMFEALEKSLNLEDGVDAAALGGEIRQSLDTLAREREERQRQQAAERKWELSQKMAVQKKEAAQIAAKPRTPVVDTFAEERAGIEVRADALDLAASDLPPLDDADRDAQPFLAPLSRNEATSDLFSEKPKLNEFLSVVKLTWKLARRSSKKGDGE